MNIFNHGPSLISRLRSLADFDPVRDWLVMVTLFIFAFICVVVWNVWAFDTVAQGGVIGDDTTKSSPLFSQASTEAIRVIFEKRSVEEAKYRTGAYRYADPSQ